MKPFKVTRFLRKLVDVVDDPHWANVISLLHFDGANDSTTFLDQKGRSWSRAGDARIATSSSKLGGASLLLDGVGDWIETPTSPDFDFGTGDFTIEAWVKLNVQTTNYMTILGSGNTSFAYTSQFLLCYGNYAPTTGQRRKVGFGNGLNNPLLLSTTLLSTGTWYHIAVSRSSGTTRLFVNGTPEASNIGPGVTTNFSTTKTLIGANGWDGAASHFNGYIDELRITKGVARYTGPFTPTAPAVDN